MTPPDIWYILKLPQEVIDYCHLSALQLEAVVYACQQHETFLADGTRAGFLIGTVYIVYVIESAAHGVICTSCLCQKPERARYERVRAFDKNNECI